MLLITSLCVVACTEEPADPHAGQPVTQRRAILKQISGTMEQMSLVLRDRKNYEPQEFAANAAELNRLASTPWSHFPAGSDYSPSHARDEVWDNPDEFKHQQQRFEDSTKNLQIAAQSHNMAEIRVAHDAVIRNCRACHAKFYRN